MGKSSAAGTDYLRDGPREELPKRFLCWILAQLQPDQPQVVVFDPGWDPPDEQVREDQVNVVYAVDGYPYWLVPYPRAIHGDMVRWLREIACNSEPTYCWGIVDERVDGQHIRWRYQFRIEGEGFSIHPLNKQT